MYLITACPVGETGMMSSSCNGRVVASTKPGSRTLSGPKPALVDINASYRLSDSLELYGYVNNLLDERAPANSLASLLGIPPFTLARTLAQARRYSREKLKAAYDYLFDLEYRLKSGQTPQEGSAETALFKLDAILNGDRQTIA